MRPKLRQLVDGDTQWQTARREGPCGPPSRLEYGRGVAPGGRIQVKGRAKPVEARAVDVARSRSVTGAIHALDEFGDQPVFGRVAVGLHDLTHVTCGWAVSARP